MQDLTDEALDDLDEAASRLAHWVTSADSRALLQIAQGFGAALSSSASMRSDGIRAEVISLALAERAHDLQLARSAQHAGWLLLSIKLELIHHLAGSGPLPRRGCADELLREVDEIVFELMVRGTRALAEV